MRMRGLAASASLKLKAVVLLSCLGFAFGAACVAAQETQSVPGSVGPAPGSSSQLPAPPLMSTQPSGAPKAAPVVRRSSHAGESAVEPVAGPLTRTSAPGLMGLQPGSGARSASSDVGTIKVQARLVNVALNVVDAHGAPVGGFEKRDFQIFENGKPQTIAVFEREATSPLSIVLAIDSSETVLTSDRLERQAAKHFVAAILREQDELDLMDFADTVREIVPFTNQVKRVERGLGDLQQGEETALYNAVLLASERLGQTSAAANRRRVLVVISDGGDSLQGGEKYEQAIAEAQRAGAIIYSIIIVPIAADAGRNTGGEHALIQMSEDTGGKYYYVTDPADLEPAFRHVSEDLRTQYLLGYYAPEVDGDSSFRRIKVTLADGAGREGFSLRYRTGYFPNTR
jgi:Ca-activated chloride channel family protein